MAVPLHKPQVAPPARGRAMAPIRRILHSLWLSLPRMATRLPATDNKPQDIDPTMTRLRTLAALGCALLVTACATTTTTTDESAAPGTRFSDSDIQATAPGTAQCIASSQAQNAAGVQATNAVRRGAGLPPVRSSTVLAEAAARHACDMAQRGRMAHHGSGSKGPSDRVKSLGYQPMITAENIAAGPYGLERVLAEWNGSSGHRANMLIPQVSEFGIGQAIGPDGRTRFWAAVYAAPRGR